MIAPPTPEYADQLRHAHQAALRVTLYSAGVLIGELPATQVSMTIDGQAEIWRTANISIGVDFWDTETREWLEQANVQTGELTIEHGIRWPPTDTIHWVQLARLRINALNMGLLSASRDFTAHDRAMLLSEHLLLSVRPLTGTYRNLIQTLLQETLPAEPLTVQAPPVSTTLSPAPGKSLDRAANRLTEIQHLAQALDAYFYNTPDGGFRLAKPYDDTTIVWEVNAGDDGVLVNLSQDFSRDEQFNTVGIEFVLPNDANGEPQEKFALAIDMGIGSPTNFNGPFGKRVAFFQEEFDHLPSTTEAENFAARKLAEYSGATRGLSISTTYNPLLQPGDRISVTFPDTGDVETHIIEAISLVLGGGGGMSIETRLVQEPALFTTFANAFPETIETQMPEPLPAPAHYRLRTPTGRAPVY